MRPTRIFLATLTIVFSTWIACGSACLAMQDHDHGDPKVRPPRIFLEKSRRIVDFQLKRLDNHRLLLVERKDDDPKYLPVHEAILKRDGIASGDREAALLAIETINQTDAVSVLFSVIESLDLDNRSNQRIAKQLASLLASQPIKKIQKAAEASDYFNDRIASENKMIRESAMAALLTMGGDQALEKATSSATSYPQRLALLNAILLTTNADSKSQLRPLVLEWLGNEKLGNGVRLAAMNALRAIGESPKSTFTEAAKYVENDRLRRAAIRTMASVQREDRDPAVSRQLVEYLVKQAAEQPASERTSDQFLEQMQFTDQLLGLLPQEAAETFRTQMNEIAVRVVLLETVEEEMRYDQPWFAVEAGREFQIVLRNEDLMPHNLVFTRPGKLEDVALAGAAIGPTIGPSGKQYVPKSDDVIAATEMVPAHSKTRLTFRAPTEPGEYPYVCTFPGHWMRMYGVMVVVEDLAAFQRNPVEPKDPVGSNRAFVKAWKVNDFEEKLASGLRGRTELIGKKIFQEATCATCHVVAGEGKAIGPELTDVFDRWKGDTAGILREILEPSHKIDAKYVVRNVLTVEGQMISGLVVKDDKESVSILPTAESPEPLLISKDDIEESMDSPVSVMPKALLDRFSEDEIFELMAYLKAANDKRKK